METQIQYVKTSDGVTIASWTLTDRQPLVGMPGRQRVECAIRQQSEGATGEVRNIRAAH